MSDFVQGDMVRDYFTLVDSSNIPITGATIINGATEDPAGDSFPLDITEIGGGVYRVEFLADTVGTWYYRVDTVGLTPDQSWEETFTIGPYQLFGAALGTSAYGPTLVELVQEVAVRNGDFLELFATDDGSADGTSFVDNLRLAAIPSQALKGASLKVILPVTSGNYLEESRVRDSDEDTQVLTLGPALPAQVLAGDTAWLTNLYSKGYWWNQYVNAINSAIGAAYPAHLVKVEYPYASSWNQDDPTIALPIHLTHIYGVRVDDGVNLPWLVPFSDQNISTLPGWYYDFSAERLGLSGTWNYQANAGSVSVLGYGRPAKLTNPDDRTTVDQEWIALYATELLKIGKGDQKLLSSGAMFGNKADTMRPKIISGLEPGTIQIR